MVARILTFPSGEVVARYTGVESDDIYSAWNAGAILTETRQSLVDAMQIDKRSRPTNSCIRAHPQEIHQQAIQNCNLNEQQQQICQLLREYGDVFSRGNDLMGLTHLTQHDTSAEGRPSAEATCLGPENYTEVEREIQNLLQKGLIEPASGAWISPVFLVRKK